MEFKKKGMQVVPIKPVLLQFECKVASPMKLKNNKQYIDFELSPLARNSVHEIHVASNQFFKSKFINVLDGPVLKIKVPFKYNKVMCKVSGSKTMCELGKDDAVKIVIEYCGIWDVNGFCGPSWKLISLETSQ